MTIKKKTKEVVKKTCTKCTKPKALNLFYATNSDNFSDKKYPVCKVCLKENLNLSLDDDLLSEIIIDRVQNILLELNRPFIYDLWVSSIEEVKKTNKDLFGLYIKNVILNFKKSTWKDSVFSSKESIISTLNSDENNEVPSLSGQQVESEDRNKTDVVRMLGYDPFEFEANEDKRHLHNKLVDMLDDSTLEDGFKLQASIEIVKGFNQIDKINRAISTITSDIKQLSTNAGGIKSLIDSKKNILASLLKLAEDNGISVKHNNQKSKGAGTLTGIIKTLQEKGFEESSVNLFDIETCEGMLQVANISNESIMKQLNFDENDYTSMILDQRQMLQDLESKVTRLEEENRLLKIELLKYKK